MSKKRYPKVLIVNSQSVKADNATGITLRSLWKDWPKENVLELYEDTRLENVDDFSLSSIVLPLECIPLKKTMLGKRGKSINHKMKNSSNFCIKRCVKKIRQNFVYLADLSPVKVDFDTKEKILQFAPDVIYTLGGGVVPLKLSYQIAKELDLPIVIHFMDNWTESLQENDLVISKIYFRIMSNILKKCLSFLKYA